MTPLLKLSTIALLLTDIALAKDAGPNDLVAAEVGVQIEYIEVDHSTASKLVHNHDGDGTSLRLQLQSLVEAGSAHIINSSYLHLRESEEHSIQSVTELIYPTEYDPPLSPKNITGTVAPDVDLIVPAAPTAFDVRHTGHTLNLKAGVDPGTDMISLNLSADLVEHTGDQVYGREKMLAIQPTFDVLNDQTNVLCRSGNDTLVAMHTPRAEAGKVGRNPSKRILVMLRATILKTGPRPLPKTAPVKTHQDPNDPFSSNAVGPGNPIQIGTLLEYIKVDAATANRLARQHAADHDASKFRGKLDAFITDGRAEELGSAYILSTAGQRAKTESIHEFIYPSEYDPPGFGQLPKTCLRPLDPITELPILPVKLTAFDVRNIGGTLEVEPNFNSDRPHVSLNVAAERVRFINFLNYGKGNAISQQPLFFGISAASNLRVPSGGTSLFSMQMARDETATGSGAARLAPTHRILVFLKSTAFEVTPADENK